MSPLRICAALDGARRTIRGRTQKKVRGAASSPTGPSLRHLDLPDEPGLGEDITGLKLALQHRGHLLGPRARRDDLVSCGNDLGDFR